MVLGLRSPSFLFSAPAIKTVISLKIEYSVRSHERACACALMLCMSLPCITARACVQPTIRPQHSKALSAPDAHRQILHRHLGLLSGVNLAETSNQNSIQVVILCSSSHCRQLCVGQQRYDRSRDGSGSDRDETWDGQLRHE